MFIFLPSVITATCVLGFSQSKRSHTLIKSVIMLHDGRRLKDYTLLVILVSLDKSLEIGCCTYLNQAFHVTFWCFLIQSSSFFNLPAAL